MTAKMLSAFLIPVIYLAASRIEPVAAVPDKPDQIQWRLARGVVEALRRDHRGGSLIYRGKCVSESQITDVYLLRPPVTTAPLDRALDAIMASHPTLRWIDFGENAVRVIDNSARTDVLNLRVKEFRLQDVANPDLAVSAIWNIPEVKVFAAAHDITFAGFSLGAVPPEGMYTRISVDAHNTSIAEIMDKISQAYRQPSDPSWHSVWSYHECEARGHMIVDLEVM